MRRYECPLAPESMREAAAAFQSRFHVKFDSLTHFPADELQRAHARGADESELSKHVVVASKTDEQVLPHFAVLTRIANLTAPSERDRANYFATLQAIYRCLDDGPSTDGQRLVVAPEREGRILAQALGWLGPRDMAPHAKRIPYEHGLLVGVSGCKRSDEAQELVFIDGAIASGATIIALLGLLGRAGVPIRIYSVHAAQEGLRTILRYAAAAGLSVRIHVGHVTEGLSPKFYAVDSGSDRVVVGDLGDMIASVAAT